MSKTLNTFYFLFILILFVILIYRLFHGYAKESWHISEWLINYQGGFVRRGLFGEVLLNLYNYFNLSPYFTILFLCISAYFGLLLFFVKSFIQKGYNIFILPFAFFLGAPIINDFIIRKDVLIILIFILIIYLSNKKSKGYLFFVNLFFIFGLLIHEELGFFCFPVLLLIIINNNKSFYKGDHVLIKSTAVSLIQLSPAIATFGLCLFNNGSLSISKIIWNSWKPIAFPIQNKDDFLIPAAIDGLSWTLNSNLRHIIYTLKNFNDGIYAPLIWFIILLLIYYLLTNTRKLNAKILNYNVTREFGKTNISNILIFQFISFIPLFILGCDYGRWVFLWVSSSFSIITLMPGERIAILFPEFIRIISSKINKILDSIFDKSREFVYFIVFIIGVPFFNWELSTYLRSNAIIIVLKSVSKFIEILFFSIKTLVF